MESKLETIQCHFTWDLESSKSTLFHLQDNLEDIGTKEGYFWLGHIYNLQGFIQYQLDKVEDAQNFFSRATEAFRQVRNTVSDEGPWLAVNYGNLAWFHYELGELAESKAYLSKLDSLTNEYPPPFEDELHPEIYAEKAWTLMKFGKDKQTQAVYYFNRAIRMQPDIVEWQTSHVLALVNAYKHSNAGMDVDILEKMRIAKRHDPENLYLAALYLAACAQRGTKIQDEARELARRVLRKPVSSYSGIKPLLMLYRMHFSVHEAIDLIEEALERHPNERYLKWCAAICYRRKIFFQKDSPLEQSVIDRAISLCEEVISLYPHSSLKMKITLANIYSNLNEKAKSDQMYKELLHSDLDLEEKQMLYNYYAKHLHFSQKDFDMSIKYYMKSAEIPQPSLYREDSIEKLKKISARHRNQREIQAFLLNLNQ
ncbi:interferon-induced protein with tetratricopeptide repeats 1-like [Pholidichthys leucotaenia]